METPAQFEERARRLDRQRQARRGRAQQETGPPSPDGRPIEIAPGRGDLTYTSSPGVPAGGDWLFPGGTRSLWTVGGRPVSFAKLFCTQPWVAASVMRMLTWSIRVPLKVYRREGDDPADRHRLRAGEHPLADAIREQDGRSAAQFVMNMLGPVLVHGNSVTEVASGVGDTVRFDPKDWRYCEPLIPFRDRVAGWKFDTDEPGEGREVPTDEVLHVAYWSPDGPLGVSPLQQLGVTLQIEDAAQRFIRASFVNGARPPSAIVATPEWLTAPFEERQQVLEQLRQDLTFLFAGPENAGKPALLPPGLSWQAVGSTSFEAELTDQRKVDREEVASVYQIPPPMIGILDKATYSNIKTQREMIYTDCMGPPLILCESAMNAQIVWRMLGERDVFVEFDFGAVLRGDRLEEIGAIREAIGTALFTPNEGRSIINMPRSTSTGMDDFYLPFNNLQPVGSRPMPGLVTSDAGVGGARGDDRDRRLHVRERDRDYAVSRDEWGDRVEEPA
jgi:HK97 family phage portal protein